MTRPLVIAARTDRGQRRAENQDSIMAETLGNSDRAETLRISDTAETVRSPGMDGETYLLAVADGVGGGPAGKLASEQTLLVLKQFLSTQPLTDPVAALHEGIQQANDAVLKLASEDEARTGMASTLVTALVQDGHVWLANVGDSRAYLIKDGAAQRLTRDHSWVAEEVEAGRMTDEQAASDPRRNLITRAIGTEAGLEPDLYEPFALEDAEILLLCSDGLYGLVSDAEIAAICVGKSLEEAADVMVALANERGGPDNISIVVASA
jgi:protein phosphatase